MSAGLRRIPLWLKVAWTGWVAVWAPLYALHYGLPNFLWFCDIGNFVIAAALWAESPLLFSWQAVSLIVVQTAYTVDILGRLVLGRHPVGGTEYVFDPAAPLTIRLLALFHCVVPVLLVWAVARLGYDRRGFLLQCVTAWIVLPVCWLTTGPDRDLNWVWGPFDRPQHWMPAPAWLAACMIAYPLLLYGPTHVALARWARKAKVQGPSSNAQCSC